MRFILLIVTLLLACGLYGVLHWWPYSRNASFSQHVARYRTATIYYFWLFLVTLPPLVWYFASWLLPTYNLPGTVLALVTCSCALQLACTLIPETHGWRVPLHRTLASLSGLMLLPIELLIFTSLPSITPVRFSFIAGIVTQLALLAILVLKRRSSMPWTFQVAYYAGFFLPLMILTFFHTQPVN